MNASDKARRTIVRNCKYQPIARVVQHDEAKLVISKFLRSGEEDVGVLTERAQNLRDRLADSDFDRDLYDHNADYIDRVAEVFPDIELPKAAFSVPGQAPALNMNGVRVNTEIQFRLRRLTKTNKIRIGACMFRYAKGKALPQAIGEWQSAFLFGYLSITNPEEATQPERKLCITLDGYAGIVYPAPGDSVRRFQNMEAACKTIADGWDKIEPPPGAVL